MVSSSLHAQAASGWGNQNNQPRGAMDTDTDSSDHLILMMQRSHLLDMGTPIQPTPGQTRLPGGGGVALPKIL